MFAVSNILFPIFSLILIGFLCRRLNILGSNAASELNRFVVWLCLPALLFSTAATASWEQIWHPGFIAVSAISTLLVFVITLLYRHRSGTALADASIDGLSAAYANTGYIGIPLCLLVFGDAGLAPALIATLIVVCVLFAIAITCLEIGLQSEAEPGAAIVKVQSALAKNPLVTAPLLGACWNLAGFSLAAPVTQLLKTLGDATAPCALVSLGLFLAASKPGEAKGTTGLVVMKLFIQPLLAWLLAFYVFSLPVMWASAALLLSALPTGTGPFMLAELYQREAALVSRTILLSTLGSLLTLSLCLYWINSL